MRTYSTAQVVRLLELHPDWEFQAPQTRELFAQRATRRTGVAWIQFDKTENGRTWSSVEHGCIDLRSDWTRVKPAKVKREKFRVCQVPYCGSVTVRNEQGNPVHVHKLLSAGWTLYAVKEST